MSLENFFASISDIVEQVDSISSQTRRVVDNFVNTTKVSNILTAESENPPTDPEEASSTTVRLDPDPNNPIPVLYGRGQTAGILVDATLGSTTTDLWLVYIISEKTGKLLSTETTIDGNTTYDDSTISLKRVFVNDYEVVFQNDGVTFDYIKDTEGNTDNSWRGLIKIYFYNDGANSPAFPVGFTGTPIHAKDVYPNKSQTSYFTFDELCFALVKITYNAEKDLDKIPKLSFDCENTLKQPGDVLFDYLTNSRYGAGLSEEDINA